MELRDIEYFAVIAEHRHLGRAAEALDLTTAALSKSLRRLESSVQAKLVKRTPYGVELTLEGDALLSRVRSLRSSLADVAREIADLSNGRSGHLRIGAHAGVTRARLVSACSALLADAPKVTLELTIGSNDVLEAALQNGELDIILNSIPAPLEDAVQEPLYDDEFVVYCAAAHRLTKLERVTVADLAQERWAMWSPNVPTWKRLHQAYADHGLPPPKIAVLAGSNAFRLDVVGATDLLGLHLRGVVREAAPRYGLAEIAVHGLTFPLTTGVTYRRGAYLPPAAVRFIALLKACAQRP